MSLNKLTNLLNCMGVYSLFKVKVIRNMKKISALMLAVILVFNMLPSIAVFADNEDGEEVSPRTQSENVKAPEKASSFSDNAKKWYNKESTGLDISSEEEIRYLAYLVNSGEDSFKGKTISLKSNITMQGTFVPIGSENKPFKGTFNGNNHLISGGSISGENDIGLFGVIEGAKILNLNINDIKLESKDNSSNVGGLVGRASNSTIEFCENLGVNIDYGKDYIGGIVGRNYNGYISNCTNQSEIKAEGNCVGGIVGYNEGIIANCTNNGKVTGKLTDSGNKQNSVGGIVGYSKKAKDEDTGNNEREEITGCKNYGEIVCNYSEYVGGIVGKTDMSVSENENHGKVKSEHDYVGGIAGTTKVEITDCKNSGEIIGNSYVGGIVGQPEADISGCSNSGSITGKKDNIGGIVGYTESHISICVNSGEIKGKSDKVDKDGNVNIISNVGGIVGYTKSSVDDCQNSGNVDGYSKNTGGITGYTEGSTSTCTNSGEINGESDNVGGIVGYTKGSVDNCKNFGNVNGYSKNTGGITGYTEGSTSTCTNSGEIKGENDNVGGVVGYAKNSISDCINAGKVKGSTKNIGGIVGSNENIVSNCTNNATVEGTGKSTGNDQDNGKHIGGIVGYARSNINGCTNNGRIEGENDNVGGIVGSISNLKITNCKNYGYIHAWRSIGGIVGDARNTNIESCENNGNVNSKGAKSGEGNGTHVGGIVGYAINVNIRSSINRGNIEGSDNVAGISGYSEGEGVNSWDKKYGIYNCTNEGQISGQSEGNTNVGGIIGYGKEIQVKENCVNKGKILGYYYVGGITGSTSNCTVRECTNFGEIRGWEDVGGIAGTFKGSSDDRNYLGHNKNKGSVYGNDKYNEIAGYYSKTHYYKNDEDGRKSKIKNKSDIGLGSIEIADNTPVQVKSVTPVAKQNVAAPVMMVSKSLLPVVKTPYEETNTAEQTDMPNKLDESKNVPSNSAKSISEDESEEEATTFFSNLFNYIKGHLENICRAIERNIDKMKEFLKNNWDRIVENIDRIKNRVQSLAESYILRK